MLTWRIFTETVTIYLSYRTRCLPRASLYRDMSRCRLSVLQMVRPDQTWHHQWSPGPRTAAIIVPPLPQLIPPSDMDFLSTILLWQSFLAQGVYRLQYHSAKALSMVIMLHSYLYVLNYLAGLAGIQLHVA